MAHHDRDPLRLRPRAGDATDAERWTSAERQAMREVSRRGLRGAWIHPPLWIALGLSAGLDAADPLFFRLNAVVFAAVALLRVLLSRRIGAWIDHHPLRARVCIAATVLAVATHWGLIGLAVVLRPVTALMETLPIVLVGVASTTTMVLALDPLIRRWYALLVLAPILFGVALHPHLGDLFTAVGAVVLAFYIQVASRQVYDDYWNASMAREAVERRARELDRLSRTDPLTGVLNRRGFDERLATAWAAAAREGRSLAVLMVDLDHFKRINDRHGHPFGDRCLQAAAQAIGAALRRPQDELGRHGGEEFAALLPETDAAGALAVAERVRAALAAIELRHDDLKVSLRGSIGVWAQVPEPACDAACLVERADQALYDAKESGRDRAVLWGTRRLLAA